MHFMLHGTQIIIKIEVAIPTLFFCLLSHSIVNRLVQSTLIIKHELKSWNQTTKFKLVWKNVDSNINDQRPSVFTPPFILAELLYGTRDQCVAQVTPSNTHATGFAPHHKLSTCHPQRPEGIFTFHSASQHALNKFHQIWSVLAVLGNLTHNLIAKHREKRKRKFSFVFKTHVNTRWKRGLIVLALS